MLVVFLILIFSAGRASWVPATTDRHRPAWLQPCSHSFRFWEPDSWLKMPYAWIEVPYLTRSIAVFLKNLRKRLTISNLNIIVVLLKYDVDQRFQVANCVGTLFVFVAQRWLVPPWPLLDVNDAAMHHGIGYQQTTQGINPFCELNE